MSNDAAWAESVQQFQQMLSQSWGNMLQAMQPGELNKAMAMPPSTPVNFAGDKLLELQQQYLQDMRALWGQGMLPQMPKTGDRRFAGENWAQNPLSVYSVTAYQMQARALMGMVDAVEADEKTRARIRFGVEQWLAAMSPSNFLAFNADAQKKAIETHGESIAKGVANLLHDMRQGHISMTDESRFEVGRNVATTEGAVVFENELFQLLEYKPLTAKVYERPLLMVPPCINKYYILDLREKNSYIKWCVDQGHTVFVISWVNPDERLAEKSFDSYLLEGTMAAVDAIVEQTGAKEINAAGYCLGGTLLATAAAAMARDGDERLASLTLLASEIDYRESGEVKLFVDDSQLAWLEAGMWRKGYLEGWQMAASFQMLNSRDLIWSRRVREYLLGERGSLVDLMAWNADTTRMPYRMHSEYLRHLYMNNDLAEGRWQVDGQPVTVADIRVPLFVVGTLRDHVAPWRSVYKIHLLNDSDISFVLTSGGHNAGIVSEPGRPRRSYQIATRKAGARYRNPDQWQAETPVHEGSWWPAWSAWLAHNASAQVAPPPMGGKSGSGKTLGAAPGTYVMQK